MKNEDTRTPKIMHVVLSLGAGGGAEKLVYDMVRHETFAENPPAVCCLQLIGPLGEKLQSEGFRVYCRSRKNGLDLRIISWLSRLMKEENIEVVHAHQYTPLFYAVPAALLAGGIKVVYTEHGRLYPEKRRWKRYLFNQLLVLGVDYIVSISESTKKAMACYDNFPERKIRVVHNGVDFRALRPEIDIKVKRRALGLDEKSRIIGTAARLEDIKNIPMMLRVFKKVLQRIPDTYLLIAGRGTKEEELKELSFRLGIGDRVRFLGLRYDLPEIYRLFEVFVLTSYTEGISITLLEAMASGIPAVVTNVGGNKEVVLDGVTGFLVDLDDETEMAERVSKLLGEVDIVGSFGEYACARVEQKFSFNRMISQYRGLYHKCTA